MQRRYLLLLLLISSLPVLAETGKPSYVPPAPVVTADSMLQMTGGLLLVLAIIGGFAWLLKRFSLVPISSAGVIKVIAATGVGQRERVVVVEIDKTWLVLGIAPGCVNKLHAMNKPAADTCTAIQDDSSAKTFATQLNESLKKEHAK